MKLHHDIKFFYDTLRATSQHLNVRLEFVEKDYWITLLLSKKLTIIIFCISSILLITCGKVVWREIECREFSLKGEHYWFPLNIGDSVSFTNSSNLQKTFIVKDKYISHRTKYISDTGCGCYDLTEMLLISGNDSIWFNNHLVYIEDREGTYREDMFFVIDGVQSGFYETHRTIIDSYEIDSISFNNVERFDYDYSESENIVSVYRVKNLGIIRFIKKNGEVWTNDNLTEFKENTIDSFNYSENTCE